MRRDQQIQQSINEKILLIWTRYHMAFILAIASFVSRGLDRIRLAPQGHSNAVSVAPNTHPHETYRVAWITLESLRCLRSRVHRPIFCGLVANGMLLTFSTMLANSSNDQPIFRPNHHDSPSGIRHEEAKYGAKVLPLRVKTVTHLQLQNTQTLSFARSVLIAIYLGWECGFI